MQVTTALAIILVLECCELCFSIRVPVVWNNDDVDHKESHEDFTIEEFTPQNVRQKPLPVEYFEYTAKKPRLAINIAASHGVESPEDYYRAYPVRPYTGVPKPQLGKHRLLDKKNNIFEPYQKLVQNNSPKHAVPVSSNYEVFHPYKAEEPLLQAIYKDPVLHKIRHDLENNKERLQNYEKQAEKSDIGEDEYLETPEQTEKKLFSQKNTPTEFEIHQPQRRPAYYTIPPKSNHRDQILNQKLRHPWDQDHVKIKPQHYHPLKNHIHDLRQQHATKYDDERNEYPQIQYSQSLGEPEEGYDIYERGKEKFSQLRNNFDDSINKAVLENRPAQYEKLELQNSDVNAKDDEEDDEEEEFVPVKNYAQVRKTETIKHLPREAALEDAENYEEIQNAPRLREAVKSKKAQTVYSEEGYEDSAYDHAGEQKHASENEDHAGYLKQLEESRGRYKTPTISTDYDDAGASEYRDETLHNENWDDDKKNNEKETEEEEYSEVEDENSAEADIYSDKSQADLNRNKRENKNGKDTNNNENIEVDTNHTKIIDDTDKLASDFEVPEINLDSTFLTEKEIVGIAEKKLEPKKDNIKDKYPYYFKNFNSVNKHSPLRYAENFKFIPNKSEGGTEFYDSRSKFVCPEVEDVDPLPEDLKNGKNPNKSQEQNSESEEQPQKKGEKSFNIIKEQPRLSGLGDKIDCFKAKYFGENPLDSPFFKEEIIADPEPLTLPNLSEYKLKLSEEPDTQESNNVDLSETIPDSNKSDIFMILDKLRANPSELLESTIKEFDKITKSTVLPMNTSEANVQLANDSNIFSNILNNIRNNEENITNAINNSSTSFVLTNNILNNTTHSFIPSKEDVTTTPHNLRRKRAAPFIYEPYKIIRESQAQDTKKTATGNISPLLKQMQTSRVVDRVTRANRESDKKFNNNRAYKDIGREDRPKSQNIEDTSDDDSADIEVDQRRGEPRYEFKPSNHKTEYTPVENKKSLSRESHTNAEKNDLKVTSQRTPQIRRNSRQRKPTFRPVINTSNNTPTTTKLQNVAASNMVKKILATTTATPDIKSTSQTAIGPQELEEDDDSDEEYEEYDEEEDIITTITTTTTAIPPKKHKKITTTTEKLLEELTTQAPKLRLVTRFRNFNQEDLTTTKERKTERPSNSDVNQGENVNDEMSIPKYREKKKKSSKSTIVTDTKKYGDEDDDMRREEVDALIGIKHDMNDYIPLYEKEENAKSKQSHELSSEESSEEDLDDEDIEDDDEDDEEDEEGEDEEEPEITTPEPTKRTLPRTTDAPLPTVASRRSSQKQKPIVSKKTVEIHKELPVNKSSPHTTEFKQDIKEVEIIKEIPPKPKRKHGKHIEALDLYKDDNLAIEVNKLGDVEVFKENLDLENGPRHGGNYRRAPEESNTHSLQKEETKVLTDTETSQSENTKQIELTERPQNRMHGGNLKSISDFAKSRNSGRSAKLIELSDVTKRPLTSAMHGGNLRLESNLRRGNRKYGKLTELDDNKRNDGSTSKDDNYRTYNSRNGGAMHGGNYRSAKIVQGNNPDSEYDIKVKADRVKDRRNAAVLLNSFAQAVPIMTTTPGYILDPSKRMYYYVEA